MGVTALLIDAENISSQYLDFVINKAQKYGNLLIRRAYADWSLPYVSSYKEGLKTHAITGIQQFTSSSGKNSSDMAMSVDAMDLAYNRKIQTFVLATSDSDFTPLAIKLREIGIHVIGIGNPNVSMSLVNACNDFHYIPITAKTTTPKPATQAPFRPYFKPAHSEPKTHTAHPANEKTTPTRTSPVNRLRYGQQDPNKIPELIKLFNTLLETKADEDGMVNTAIIGNALTQAGISIQNYGFEKVSHLIGCMHDFEMVMIDSTAFLKKRNSVAIKPPYDVNALTDKDLTPIPATQNIALINALSQSITKHQDQFGWAAVGRVINTARQEFGVDAKDYNHAHPKETLKQLTMFEIKHVGDYDYIRDTRTTPNEFLHKLPVVTEPSKQSPPKAEPKFEPKPESAPEPQKPTLSPDKSAQIIAIINQTMLDNWAECCKEDGWFSLLLISKTLKEQGIEPKELGYKNFVLLMEQIDGLEHRLDNGVHLYKNPTLTQPDTLTDDMVNEQHKEAVEVETKAPTLQVDNETADDEVLLPTEELVENKEFTKDQEMAEHAESDQDDEVALDEEEEEEGEFGLDDLLALINTAIATHANADGFAKIGDIGKFVRKAIGVGSQSFGYDDFGKLLMDLSGYEVVRQGRYMLARQLLSNE